MKITLKIRLSLEFEPLRNDKLGRLNSGRTTDSQAAQIACIPLTGELLASKSDGRY